jgi:hypothetical protein
MFDERLYIVFRWPQFPVRLDDTVLCGCPLESVSNHSHYIALRAVVVKVHDMNLRPLCVPEYALRYGWQLGSGVEGWDIVQTGREYWRGAP